jgi:hypothetical protein
VAVSSPVRVTQQAQATGARRFARHPGMLPFRRTVQDQHAGTDPPVLACFAPEIALWCVLLALPRRPDQRYSLVLAARSARTGG